MAPASASVGLFGQGEEQLDGISGWLEQNGDLSLIFAVEILTVCRKQARVVQG